MENIVVDNLDTGSGNSYGKYNALARKKFTS